MSILKSKLIRISSKDRTNGTSNNFKINLGRALNPRIKGAKLVSASYYNLFYNITTRNNVLSIVETGQVRQDIALIEGYYTSSDLFAELKTRIDAILVTGSVSLSLEAYSNKVKIDFTGTTASIVVDATSTMADSLGFATTTATQANHLSTYIPSLGGLDEIYIVSKELAGLHLIDGKDKSARGVLAILPNNAQFGSQSYWESDTADAIIRYGSERLITQVSFRIENSEGELLDMQNQHLKMIIKVYY